MTALLIIGAGGHGRVVADIAAQRFRRVAFLDDVAKDSGHAAWPIVGTQAQAAELRDEFSAVVVALGDNTKRMSVTHDLQELGYALAVVRHPSAVVSDHANIGDGSVVMPSTVVNYGANLGVSCIVNTGATIDHDCRLGDGVHVSPGAHLAGGVAVGDRAWVGIGAAVREGVTIGRDAIVGAGAAVVNDVAPGTVVRGVPAR